MRPPEGGRSNLKVTGPLWIQGGPADARPLSTSNYHGKVTGRVADKVGVPTGPISALMTTFDGPETPYRRVCATPSCCTPPSVGIEPVTTVPDRIDPCVSSFTE